LRKKKDGNELKYFGGAIRFRTTRRPALHYP
jgi:hypothetical protein